MRSRVLLVVPAMAPRLGGMVAHAAGTAAALARQGYDVSIYTTDMGRAPSSTAIERIGHEDLPPELAGADVRLFRARQPYRLVYSPGLGRALQRDLAAFDVLQIHNLWTYPQYAAARVARRCRVPYIVTVHGAFDRYVRSRGRLRKALSSRLWQDEMLAGASALQVATRKELEAIADIAPHVPRFVTPPGVDLTGRSGAEGARFRQAQIRGHDGPLVVFTGRLAYKKGLDLLIEALPSVRREVPEVRVAIVGPDDEGLTPMLAQRARALGCSDAVHFTGALYGQDLQDAMAAADAWVLPSRAENFGIAALEALAAGAPVVATTEVDVALEVAGEGACVLTEVTVGSVAEGIVRVLLDPELKGRLRGAGPATAERYSWSSVIDAHVEMVEQVRRGVRAKEVAGR